MAIPTWPAGVPYQSSTDSLSISQLAVPPLATDMNAGTTRQRRKYTLPIAEAKLSIVMTAAQLQAFRAFHRDALGTGAARFTMPVWNGSNYVSRTVSIKDQPAVASHAFDKRRVDLSVRIETL